VTSREGRTRAGQAGVSLVELLVAMAIMGVISTMLLLTWFALSNSYSYSINSANARDDGRQALARLQREIRDAQKPTIAAGTASDAILTRARPYTIAFFTTFNEVGNSTMTWDDTEQTASSSTPHLVVYRLYDNRELWRFEDRSTPLNRQIDMSNGETFDMNGSTPPEFTNGADERRYGEGATLLVANIDNWARSVPVFGYSVYGTDPDTGAVVLLTKDILIGVDRYTAIAVDIRLLVDLNPARAPVHADLRATAQLRNSR
jgi:prepilin-type N-terminal cleavage/methylation domain-containing protein